MSTAFFNITPSHSDTRTPYLHSSNSEDIRPTSHFRRNREYSDSMLLRVKRHIWQQYWLKIKNNSEKVQRGFQLHVFPHLAHSTDPTCSCSSINEGLARGWKRGQWQRYRSCLYKHCCWENVCATTDKFSLYYLYMNLSSGNEVSTNHKLATSSLTSITPILISQTATPLQDRRHLGHCSQTEGENKFTWRSYAFVYTNSCMRKLIAMHHISYRLNISWLPKKDALGKHVQYSPCWYML